MSVTAPNSIVNGNAAASPQAASGTATGNLDGLNMNDFLTLMTAQLQNQDPLNPADSNQFLNQLSELSTVEGVSQLNSTLSSLSSSMMSSQALSSAALVGHNILTPASSASYLSGSTLSGAVQLPSGANGAVVTISNASGAVVDQMVVPQSATGLAAFSWNGTSGGGASAPSGTYSVSATAQVGGQSQSASTLLSGTVSSVTLASNGGGVSLNTAQLGAVALTSVQQID